MRQWKLMTGCDCDELRMEWVMTCVLPVIATRRFSPRLRTSDNGNRSNYQGPDHYLVYSRPKQIPYKWVKQITMLVGWHVSSG